MASNQNKFIDRSPSILAAGKQTDSKGDSVLGCFKEYNVDDASSSLKLAANIREAKPEFKTEPYVNRSRHGITEIGPILRPEVKTRYQTIINELKETSYDSHWNKSLGKPRDPIPGLPRGYDPVKETCGVESKRDVTMKMLINPPKGVYQVLSESQMGHELYKKSHNDYGIGEKVNRNYVTPPYDCNKRFGHKTKYDQRGIWVRCACTWHNNEPVVFCNEIQANRLNRTRHKLGKCSSPNDIADKLPKDFTFGSPSRRSKYGVEELLKDYDVPVCEFMKDFRCWISSLNKLQIRIKNRGNKWGLNLQDLHKRLLYHDPQRSDYLPLEIFYKVCSCEKIEFDRANLEPLLALLGILREGRVNYTKFLDILDYKKPPMELVKIDDLPIANRYYVSSNQAASCDYLVINNAETEPAGIPTIRHDLGRPSVPEGRCRADLESLGDETSVAILINPSVFVNYGLSFRDFFVPREKSVIKRLFEGVGYKLEEEPFEKMWDLGVAQDKTGLVCVDTFNKLLLAHYPDQRKLVVDEATC